MARIRGLRGQAAAVVSGSALTFGRSLRATGAVSVTAQVRAAALRGMSATATVVVGGQASLPGVVDLAAEAVVSVTGLASLGGKFLEAQAAVSVTAQASATRWRRLGATAAASVTQTSALARVAGFYGAAFPGVSALPADPDVIRAGIRIAWLSSFPTVEVLAQSQVRRIARLAAQAGLTVLAAAAPTRLRTVWSSAAVSVAAAATLVVRRPDGAEALISVSAQARLGRVAGLRAVGQLSVQASAPQLVLVPAALRADSVASVSATLAGFDRIRGLLARAVVAVDAAAGLEVRTPTLLAAQAAVSVTSSASIRVARDWAGTGTITVIAVADLRTNIFDDEPDYRSFVVPRQEFAFVVPRQEFVAFISSDAVNMITYSKQPADRLAYDFEFADWFEELEGDDIEAAAVQVVSASIGVPADLVVEQPLRINSPSTRVKIWIEGGVNGARYKLTLTIDTEGGRRKTVDFYMRVKEL